MATRRGARGGFSGGGRRESTVHGVEDNGPGMADEHLPNLFRQRLPCAGASRAIPGARDSAWQSRSNSWKPHGGANSATRSAASRGMVIIFTLRTSGTVARRPVGRERSGGGAARLAAAARRRESRPSDAGSGTAIMLSRQRKLWAIAWSAAVPLKTKLVAVASKGLE